MTSLPPYNIAWLTTVPSGDQIDLLRAVARRPELNLTVIYCSPQSVKGIIEDKEPLGRGLLLKGIRLPGPGGKLFFNPSIISKMLRVPYDLVFVAGYIHPTMQLAMIVRALRKQPWVLFAERPGMNRRSLWAKHLRSFPLLTIRTADALVVTGRVAQQEYQQLLGAEAKVFSMPYLVNLEPFAETNRQNDLPPNGLSFLACGELIPRKGIDVLIKAFTKAARLCPEIGLRIVGDGPERARLTAQVPESLKDRIIFAGKIPYEERVTPFFRSDIFIHPSRHDGWGVVIQEALSAGLPVIATRQTGAACDLLEEGKNGFLVNADDEDHLAERIVWFAQHREEIPGFSARARNKTRSLTPDWGAEQIVAITKAVLEKRRLEKN